MADPSSSTMYPSQTSSYPRKSPEFRFGPYVPLHRTDEKVLVDPNGVVDYYYESNPLSRKLLGEILPDDSIVDSPSMILPLLLKKRTIWPHSKSDENLSITAESQESNQVNTSVQTGGDACSEDIDDDVQFVKVVDRSRPSVTQSPTGPATYKTSKDYVKDSVIKKLSLSSDTTLAIPDYFETTLNNLLSGIGLSRVQEFILDEKFRKLTSKIKRGARGLFGEADSIRSQLIKTKNANRVYNIEQLHRCPHCPFKSEFMAVMESHLESPHKIKGKTFVCNWCNFKSKDSNQITFHTYMVHKRLSRIERPPPNYCCVFCDFEANSKSRMYINHIRRCEITFDRSKVQATDKLFDFAAVTPKFITQEDIKTYETALDELRLSAYNPHQIEVNSHDSQNNVLLVSSNTISLLPKPNQSTVMELSSPFSTNPTNLTPGASSTLPHYPNQLQQIAQTLMASVASSRNMSDIRRNALLQHPKPTSTFANGIFAVKNVENIVMAPQVNIAARQSLTTGMASFSSKGGNPDPIVIDLEPENPQSARKKGPNDSFVICEICDSYIEGFPEFKTHMWELHRVKLQKSASSSKPPLNCLKCQWRFFTDQGLERHLLGAHGLVTQGMQDKAIKHLDSGRCTICGRRFPDRLVAHTKDAHKVTLKTAQITYKCKVCSATYGLYSHFEKHVYQIHPDLHS